MSSAHDIRAMYGDGEEEPEPEYEDQGTSSFAFVDGSKYTGGM
jgi:hypothetical protein